MPENWRETIGDYKLVREIGRGAFGIVYEATQISLKRQVALKVLPANLFPNETTVTRFKQEAMAAAQLSHPNIVTVHEAGQDADLYYFSMKYVPGKSLAQIIDERGGMTAGSTLEDTDFTASIEAILGDQSEEDSPPPPAKTAEEKRHPPSRDECYEIAYQALGVAEALQYAHDEGIIHQDVKPSNLVVDESDRLCLLDFGTSQIRRLRDGLDLGPAMATPLYASPEQLSRTYGPPGPQTDVWSLGATLYEWVTIYPPFLAQDVEELRRRVLTEDPVSPRELNPAVPPDLAAIIVKALTRNLKNRYASAGKLADDLRRFIRNEPIKGTRVGPLHRFVLWRRRNPSLARAVLAIVLLAGVTIGGSLYAILSTETNLEAAERYLELGAPEVALERIKEIRETDADWPQAMRFKADCLHDLSREQERLVFFEELRKNHADRFEPGELLIGTAKTLDDLRQYDKAEKMFRRAVEVSYNTEQNSQNALAHYELAKFLHEQRKKDPIKIAEAQIEYEKSIDLDPELAKAHFAYGELLATLKKWDEAEVRMREAIKLRGPDKPKYYAGLAQVLLKRGKLAEAIVACDAAIDISLDTGHPKDAARYQTLKGSVLLAKGESALALKELKEAHTTLKDEPDTILLMGKAYWLSKEKDKTEKIANELLRVEFLLGYAQLNAFTNTKESRATAVTTIGALPTLLGTKKAADVLKRLQHPDFDSIRETAGFIEAVAALSKKDLQEK